MSSLVREPKQQRSRRSFERAIEAAIELLVERRSDAFTLAEVAKKANVSTGSIYGRVDSKEDLIRAAQQFVMERVIDDQRKVFSQEQRDVDTSLPEAVSLTVSLLADLLRRHAATLAPFMIIGNHDEEIARLGKAGFGHLVKVFCDRLLEHQDEIAQPEPRRAVEWSFTVAYSVLARWLGLGSEPEAAGEGDWEQILGDLSEMITAFLTSRGRSA